MALVEALLATVVRVDGDVLVLHVGEKPYVVSPGGHVELSTRALTLAALDMMVDRLLPSDSVRALRETGSIAYTLPVTQPAGEHFTVIAARGADDLWVEIRRRHEAPPPLEDVAPLPTVEHSSGPRPTAAAAVPAEKQVEDDRDADVPSQPAVVLPLSRSPIRHETAPVSIGARAAGLERLLRFAAARGAAALYLVAQSRPLIRVDGDIDVLEGEPALGASDIEALVLDLAPEASAAFREGDLGSEWIREIADVGRVRCRTFTDQRGAGAIFEIIPARVATAAQLGLSPEIQGLASQQDGFVLVSGPRSSGKSTLIAALVEAINGTASRHIITLESQIKFVHENRRAFVSQRELRGDAEEMARAARAALREDPDVLVLDQLAAPQVISLALDAAASGRLVIGAIAAPSTAAAIDRIVTMFAPETRLRIRSALASSLRGVVAQLLLRKAGGGRLAARELLLNTPAVANLLAEGKLSQLPKALEGGRKLGMVPFNDALVAFVQSGAIDAREAYNKAPDRETFLHALRRAGIDTSTIERRA